MEGRAPLTTNPNGGPLQVVEKAGRVCGCIPDPWGLEGGYSHLNTLSTRIILQLVRDAFQQPMDRVETKSSNTDLVTETDRAVEDLIIKELSSKFPSHK